MLSPSDEAFLNANAYSVDHDYFYMPRLLGEPFLREGTLSYFDGTAVHVMGATIPWVPEDAPRKVSDVVESWIDDARVEFINYYGPVRPRWEVSPDFATEYSDAGLDHQVELFVDLATAPSAKLARHQRQDLARARRRGIEVRTAKPLYFSLAHLTLLRDSIRRNDYGVSDASYVLNVPAIFLHPATTVFEAMTGNRTVGIGVTHEFFPGRPFFLAAAFDPEASGCSDAMYGAVIDHYRGKGARTLSLGYTPSPANGRYKSKWGGAPRLPPSHQLILRRRDSRLPFRESLHWSWRMLTEVWCSFTR